MSHTFSSDHKSTSEATLLRFEGKLAVFKITAGKISCEARWPIKILPDDIEPGAKVSFRLKADEINDQTQVSQKPAQAEATKEKKSPPAEKHRLLEFFFKLIALNTYLAKNFTIFN